MTMIINTWIAVLLLSALGSCATNEIPAQDAPDQQDTEIPLPGAGERPNIVLIMADDMGYECLGINGSTSYNTPELDQLAETGIRFTNCHAQPLCTPSRVKIMTGRYNCYNYVDFGFLDRNETTFGNIMQDAGYKTMIAGKWQLNGVNTNEEGCMDQGIPYRFGFDEYCLWWLTEKGSRYADPRLVKNEQTLNTSIDDYGPDIVCDHILDFIERNSENPFFVYYPMMLVHSPFNPTPDSPEWESKNKRKNNETKYFVDMVAYTDKIVGKIRDRLDELDLLDNTILIFTGDNGTNTDIVSQTTEGAYPGGKGYLKDNGTHVPLIISWPAGGMGNMASDALIDFTDFFPTLADAAGVSTPDNVDGQSFYDLIAGQPYTGRNTIFVHYYPKTGSVSDRNGCFARTTGYKLYSDGRYFDMVADKWEEHPLDTNLLKPGQREVYEQLDREIKSRPVWDFSTVHRTK